jgi:tetratricopeptide (TPR) repeat protein
VKHVVIALALGLVAALVYTFVEPSPAPPVVKPAPAPIVVAPMGERRAVLLEPRDGAKVQGDAPWVAANNAGVRLLDGGDVAAAIERFEFALTQLGDADGTVARSNLAEALARRARTLADARAWDDALASLERAVELDPQRTDLAAWLVRLRDERAVEGDFASYSSQRFELSFDGERSAILGGAQRAIDVLEAAYGEYWLFFGHDAVANGERIAVVLYSPEQFHALTGLGHWAGGAYDGRVRVPVADFDGDEARWTNTLWHEVAHAFLHDIAPRGLPGWLDEGLAQYLEPGGVEAAARARASLSPEALHPLAALEGAFNSLGDQGAIRRGYAQALAFTDHLVRTHGEHVVRELVFGLGRDVDVATRFRELVGFDLAVAHQDFADALE